MLRSSTCRLRISRTFGLSSCSHLRPKCTYLAVGRSCLSTSSRNRTSGSTPVPDPNLIYDAPLTTTFRRLKIFSLSSLTLSCSFAPLIFIIESQLPIFARTFLALLAVSTSGISTTMIAWISRPYVTTLRRIDPIENSGTKGLELITANWRLQTRVTRVYDTNFLTETTRPFATWQLADELALPADEAKSIPASQEETIAETFDGKGNLLGSWVVTWNTEAKNVGYCRPVGKVVKHFRVHSELFELMS